VYWIDCEHFFVHPLMYELFFLALCLQFRFVVQYQIQLQ
jgi:hypothetical protein